MYSETKVEFYIEIHKKYYFFVLIFIVVPTGIIVPG